MFSCIACLAGTSSVNCHTALTSFCNFAVFMLMCTIWSPQVPRIISGSNFFFFLHAGILFQKCKVDIRSIIQDLHKLCLINLSNPVLEGLKYIVSGWASHKFRPHVTGTHSVDNITPIMYQPIHLSCLKTHWMILLEVVKRSFVTINYGSREEDSRFWLNLP